MRGFINCYICGQDVPGELSHDHHKIPQAAAGSDRRDNLLKLCAGCHNNLHRIAEMMKTGRGSVAQDIAKAAYPDSRCRARLFELAEVVAESMILKRDGKVRVEETNLTITLDAQVYRKLRMIANEHTHSNGRTMGVAAYVAVLLEEHVQKKTGTTPVAQRKSPISLRNHPLSKWSSSS